MGAALDVTEWAEATCDHPARALERIGEVLPEGWRVEQLLGVGGAAAVFAATHADGRRGAVKLLHRELAEHEEARAQLLREGFVIARLRHPAAVALVERTTGAAPLLVTELCPGETLEELSFRRSGARLALEEVIAVAEVLLDVLAHMHALGFVHCDVKPDNAILGCDGRLKLIDFGIARPIDDDGEGYPLGTPAFMAPEQARGGPVDARTDVWGVGATMFRLLTGEGLRPGDDVAEMVNAAMITPVPSIARYTSYEIAAVIDRALAFDPAARWRDARTMRQALHEALAASGEARLPRSLVLRNLAPAPPPIDSHVRLKVAEERPSTSSSLVPCSSFDSTFQAPAPVEAPRPRLVYALTAISLSLLAAIAIVLLV